MFLSKTPPPPQNKTFVIPKLIKVSKAAPQAGHPTAP